MIRYLVTAFAILFNPFTCAYAKMDPWCAPRSADLVFSDQHGREAIRVGVQASAPRCTYDVPNADAAYFLNPDIQLRFVGRLIEVPNSCLADFRFSLSNIVVSTDELKSGVIIKITGLSLDLVNKKTRAIISIISNDLQCSQTAN